jgi:hypothetical protein
MQKLLRTIQRSEDRRVFGFTDFKKPKSSKLKLKEDIKDTIKMVESTEKPKKTNTKNISKAIEIAQLIAKEPKYNTKKTNTKNISKAIELAQLMAKEPKYVKKTQKDEVTDTINEIEKLIKAPKKDLKKLVKASEMHIKYQPSEQDKHELKVVKKVMDLSKGYVHNVKDISPATNNYVNAYKAIVSEGKTASSISKNLNKLKLDIYTKLRPSDITDANKLINDFMMSLPSKEKKTYKKKEKEVDTSYKGDKKYKPMVAYLKKHKPEITDPEDIHTIVSMIIEAKVPRMSVKKLNEIMEE